jgi:DNA-binding transcriptional MocR family regulator
MEGMTPGIVDLATGHPHPDTLPLSGWARACRDALDRFGPAALDYGPEAGPRPLVRWIGARLGQTDAAAVEPDRIFVTAGASHALDLVCTALVRPGDTVLVGAPAYHYGLGVLTDHAARVLAVPLEDPEAVARAARSAKLLYLVPTHNNPTGRSLPPAQRVALLEALRGTGTTIIEDDTYREMSFDGPAPNSLYSLAGGKGVIRIGSFAKTVGPGLRLGFLTATTEFVRALTERGYVRSGGGVNHTAALAMAAFAETGGYDTHLKTILRRYGAQRDALTAALHAHLGQEAVEPVGGGWFLWLPLPDGTDPEALATRAAHAGVSYVDGRLFYPEPKPPTQHIRLCFAMLGEPALRLGATRLAEALAS